MTTQDPIRLSAFRKQAQRPRSSAMDRQFRLSFGLVAILLTATLTVGLTTLISAQPIGSDIHAVAPTPSARG